VTTQNDVYQYTQVEQDTWRRFYSEIALRWAKHRQLLHPYYTDHIGCLERFKDGIPTLGELNALLRDIGWTAEYVDGFAPPWHIVRMIDRRIMPVSRPIRTPGEIFFANGPDLIHDIFGHLPLLFSPEYRALLAEWAQIASSLDITETDRATYHLNRLITQAEGRVAKHTLAHLKTAASRVDQFAAEHPSPSQVFDKTYFWIFEFGIVKHEGELRLLGSGLLSSMREIEKIAAQKPKMKALDCASILSPYNISTLQDSYLVASSVQQYSDILQQMKARLERDYLVSERLYARG